MRFYGLYASRKPIHRRIPDSSTAFEKNMFHFLFHNDYITRIVSFNSLDRSDNFLFDNLECRERSKYKVVSLYLNLIA